MKKTRSRKSRDTVPLSGIYVSDDSISVLEVFFLNISMILWEITGPEMIDDWNKILTKVNDDGENDIND